MAAGFFISPQSPVGLNILSNSGATYTLALTDANALIRYSHTSTATITIPLNSSVPFEIGTVIYFEQQGAGVIDIVATGGVTLVTTAKKTWGQYSVIQLYKVAIDTWNIIGGSV